ncbi:MAG: sodium:calcium antiporter [Deltaproteobacteria bacterium]|nr:sodium:calcium antiporter [Deltaproteobacteria bacterium]MBW2070830.1 sodium:calcium antiporter [Deltaproteobacteria bacterium]
MHFLYLLLDEHVLNRFVSGLPGVWLIAVLVCAIVVLLKGANWAIDGAVSLAERMQLPRIVIGATIISLGTTMPEMFVSTMAAWMGDPGLALGNGVGSIICDTGLIFGLMCILNPPPVNRYILNRTGWVQVGAATLLVVLALNALATSNGEPYLSRSIGVLFLYLLICYLYITYLWAKEGQSLALEEKPAGGTTLVKAVLFTIGGLFGVIVGSRVLVPVAAESAHRVGVPDDVIAATLVAFGTSVPELITAISAVRKGHPEIMIGNVVGADVLNCLFVIGAAAVAKPLFIQTNFYLFHFPAMLIILYSFRAFIFMNKDGRFKRWQGIWILGVYLLYLFLQYTFNLGSLSG